jgi:hypothetical protein
MANPRVLVLGLPYFGTRIADALGKAGWEARFLPHPGRSPAGWARVGAALIRADVLYLVSARVERHSPLDVLLRAWRRPVAVHWVGTDVLIAREQFAAGRLSHRAARRPTHWADAPWLVDELAEMGIEAEFVRLPVHGLAAETLPLPERFKVLLYLPVDAFDREVFDTETILHLPDEFPDVPFILIPSPPETLPPGLPPNLDARAWVDDMDALYREISVVVRLVSHDGMPFMALEAFSRGRYVVYPCQLPGATVAAGFEAARAAVAGLLARHEAGTLTPNAAGADWVRREYEPTAVIAELDRRLRGLISTDRPDAQQ